MAESKTSQQVWDFSNCAVIVAHPHDETIWAGGAILLHGQVRWTVISLSGKDDPDLAAKFERACEKLGVRGTIGDLDAGSSQTPLPERQVQKAIRDLLPADKFDLVITHSRWGEFTRDLRHEETAKAVLTLRNIGDVRASQLWMFAYEDGGGKYLPKPVRDADVQAWLPEDIWQEKKKIITEIYGFAADSFEARAVPRQETFWRMGSRTPQPAAPPPQPGKK